MSGLAPGATWLVWPQTIAASGPGLPPRLVDSRWLEDLAALAHPSPMQDSSPELAEALGSYLIAQATEPADRLRLKHVQILDREFLGWLPDFAARSDQTLATLEDLWARHRLWHARTGAQPCLPGSLWYRQRMIAATKAKRVLMMEDPDGLALVLAGAHDVLVYEPEKRQMQWLREQADRLGVSARLSWQVQPENDDCVDITVMSASDLHATARLLAQAIKATRSRGHILLSVNAPADQWVYALAQQARLALVDRRREVDHRVLPTGHLTGAAGDLLLFERLPEAGLDTQEAGDPSFVATLPYWTIDFDSLDPDRMTVEIAERWLDWVGALSGVPAASFGHRAVGDAQVLWWYAVNGSGLLVHLRPADAGLLMLLLPYDRMLEQAATYATWTLLADEHTRLRAHRPRVVDGQAIMT
jgi:hypothetical protein